MADDELAELQARVERLYCDWQSLIVEQRKLAQSIHPGEGLGIHAIGAVMELRRLRQAVYFAGVAHGYAEQLLRAAKRDKAEPTPTGRPRKT